MERGKWSKILEALKTVCQKIQEIFEKFVDTFMAHYQEKRTIKVCMKHGLHLNGDVLNGHYIHPRYAPFHRRMFRVQHRR